MRDADFVTVQQKVYMVYKVPFENWANSTVLKEAGKYMKDGFMEGMEWFATDVHLEQGMHNSRSQR